MSERIKAEELADAKDFIKISIEVDGKAGSWKVPKDVAGVKVRIGPEPRLATLSVFKNSGEGLKAIGDHTVPLTCERPPDVRPQGQSAG